MVQENDPEDFPPQPPNSNRDGGRPQGTEGFVCEVHPHVGKDQLVIAYLLLLRNHGWRRDFCLIPRGNDNRGLVD